MINIAGPCRELVTGEAASKTVSGTGPEGSPQLPIGTSTNTFQGRVVTGLSSGRMVSGATADGGKPAV